MPVVDLRHWEAHIPGVRDTPWEGGVYSLRVEFWPGFPERIPKFRFFVPLCHPPERLSARNLGIRSRGESPCNARKLFRWQMVPSRF
ncbi:hypothetical protein DFH07DRAFT_116101 [Mycena maculata]|uniref:UBC core domain-containing protein n=1 Tax=Mycena maculata TaxID=230809 RepID=A0AAD7MXI9_9AGAR|nr:hypothetical protein DFH07DRAFT_116101 [Mycena maculata]